MLKAIQPVCSNKHIFLMTIHFCHSHPSSHGCSLKAEVTLPCWLCSSLLWDGKESEYNGGPGGSVSGDIIL